MLHTLLKRLLNALLVIFGVLLFTFILMHVIPGDPTDTFIGQYATPETVQALRDEWGLDQPITQRFVHYLINIFKMNLGHSYFTGQPVFESIVARLPTTCMLAFIAIMLAIFIGIPIGFISAIFPDKWFSKLCMQLTILGISLPVFWAGLLFLLGASQLDTLWPFNTMTPLALSILLGAIVLGLRPIALIARLTCTQMLEVLHQDFVISAFARGVPALRVYISYAFRNTLAPILTLLALDIGSLLSGAVITETIFGIPGIGKFALSGIGRRDYPVIMGIVLFTAFIFVFVNLLIDLLLPLIYPKLRDINNEKN